ncbi:MAG: DUF4468 domain-containing protein [Bacteroidetes bacterium]|nr:DUF4468 domain-containing protein [Bacteroidota bacterium]
MFNNNHSTSALRRKLFVSIFTLSVFCTYAQTTTIPAPPDSIPNYNYSNDDQNQGEATTPYVKPYVRVKFTNIDSITNLVTYKEIVEQEESQEDSLYIRCLKMLKRKFGVYGKMIPINKPNEKIQVTLQMPVYTKPTPYIKTPAGTIDFTFIFDIKSGRYRYRIDHIRHLPPANSLNIAPPPVYLEYYLESKSNVKSTDLVLKGADDEIKKFIVELKKRLQDPKAWDDEDW